MSEFHTKKAAPSVQEQRLSLFLLGILVLIAGVVLALQYRYDPGQWRELQQIGDESQPAVPTPDVIEGLKPISGLEQYDANNLSDKINGKADMYLTAGFKKLESRRFGLLSDAGRWMERYIYHMDGYRSAFAVYSSQRRTDVEQLELGGNAYVAGNGLFMVHGPYYLEIIAAEVSDQMRAGAVDLAKAFVAGHPVKNEQLKESALFPKQGQVPDSTVLNANSTFGLDGLNWVFTSRYAANGHEATAFISLRGSVAEAESLALAFLSYWRDYGGEDVVLPKQWAAYHSITILDNYEIVWVQGDYLLGVHEATDLEFGLELAKRLQRAVREGRHDS